MIKRNEKVSDEKLVTVVTLLDTRIKKINIFRRLVMKFTPVTVIHTAQSSVVTVKAVTL